jgi:spermidine synthase
MKQDDVVWEGDTAYGHYQIVDALYDNRPARVLYSGDHHAAQSGVPKDSKPALLFDYNQRMFELVTQLTPARLLLIGGAVATLPTALVEALPDLQVDVIEPDSGLTELAYKYFDAPVTPRLRFFHTDARSYLRSTAARYDVILVDAFVHTTIPKELRTIESFAALRKHLLPDGVAAMNVISGYHGKTSYVLREIYAAAKTAFLDVDVFLAGRGYSLWLPQNFVLVCQDGSLPVQDYAQYQSIEPLDYRPEDIRHDE